MDRQVCGVTVMDKTRLTYDQEMYSPLIHLCIDTSFSSTDCYYARGV